MHITQVMERYHMVVICFQNPLQCICKIVLHAYDESVQHAKISAASCTRMHEHANVYNVPGVWV